MAEACASIVDDKGLSMDDVLRIRDLVYQETGMYFPDDKQYYFESRFKRRINALGMRDFREYYSYLSRAGNKRDEFLKLMNELTINETSFFRNKPHFKALKDFVISEIAEKKKDRAVKKIRFWSAGCSSGEEAYTIAMITSELKHTLLQGWMVEIVATDISERVLSIARKGEYKQYAVKSMPDEYKEKYLELNNGVYRVKDTIRNNIKFSNLNLNNDMSMLFMKGFDVVFCKNVLIYFDLASKKRVIQHFFNSLSVGGYLFIGFSESLFGVDNRFKLIHFPGGMVYRKDIHI